MNFVSYDVSYGADEKKGAEEHLQFELGWSEVRRGLGLILRGYFIIIGGALLIAVVAIVLLTMDPKDRAKIPWQLRDAGLFLGLAAFALFCIYAYGCIIVGHWRCLMNVPERCGAKWLMFACLTCILAGPALNFASGLTGVQQQPKIERGLNGIKDIKYSTEGAIMQIGSVGIQILGNVMFILFLRAVARCFEDRTRVLLVNLYLGFTGLLVVGSVGLIVARLDTTALMRYAILLGLGWVLSFVGYLVIVFIIRGGISAGLSKQAAPLDPFAVRRP